MASAVPVAMWLSDDVGAGTNRGQDGAPAGSTGAGQPDLDLPFGPSSPDPSASSTTSTTVPGGSSSRPGDVFSPSPRPGRATGSALLDQVLGAAELMGYADVTVPDLPLARLDATNPLRAAILEWVAVTGSVVPPEQLAAQLARADALPRDLQTDLAILLLSAADASVLQASALAKLTPDQIYWIHTHPEVAQDLARGVDTPETRALAVYAGLVDVPKSIQASLLMLSAVEATRGSLGTSEAQQLVDALTELDASPEASAILRLLATAGGRVSDADKVRMAAELVSAATGVALPAAPKAPTFEAAVRALAAATGQPLDAEALPGVLARADALPLDLQQALAGPLAAQAAAIDASNPDRYTSTGQADALMRVLLAVADALPTLEKYNLYWRDAPAALRVSTWEPSVRAGWAAEHAALFVSTKGDGIDVVRASAILHGLPLVDATVPERSFHDAFLALAKESGWTPTAAQVQNVDDAAVTLAPAVRDAAAHLMSGAAESARLTREAFAALSADEKAFLLSTEGVDAIYLEARPTQGQLETLARATLLAERIDAAKLAAAEVVAARAAFEAKDILQGQGAYAAAGHDVTPVPTLWERLLRLLPFTSARAQTQEVCQDLGGRPSDPTTTDLRSIIVSNDCENDVLLVISNPLEGGIFTFGCSIGVDGYNICEQPNPDLLVITGVGSSDVRPPPTLRSAFNTADGSFTSSYVPATGAALVHLDLGGADTYSLPVAMTSPNATAAVSLHVDIEGNDQYLDPSGNYDSKSLFVLLMGRANGHPTQGATLGGGAAILLDALGDDTYVAPTRSQGFGRYGLGMLADLTGSDAYTGRTFVQGASSETFNLGSGILLDTTGNDRYTSVSGQGFGLGGLLLDSQGRDDYVNEHPPQGIPIAKLDVLPGGDLTTLHIRGDNHFWLDGPASLNVGIGADVETSASGRDSDFDGDSDFLETLAGSDPNNPRQRATDGPQERAQKVAADADRDLFPDFVERALSTNPEDPTSAPAGFPVGPTFYLPTLPTGETLEPVTLNGTYDGVDHPTGDKILDLRLPLQDAGNLDIACTGSIYPNATDPVGLGLTIDGDGYGTNVFTPLVRGNDPTDPKKDGTLCVYTSFTPTGPGEGNGTQLSQGNPSSDSAKPQGYKYRLPAGILAVGDSVRTRYDVDYFFVVDIGGDDTFDNHAAGALLAQTQPQPGSTASSAAYNSVFLAPSLVVNVDPSRYAPSTIGNAEGDAVSRGRDLYRTPGEGNLRRNFTQGSLLGVLVDVGGDDTYLAGSGSQGSMGGILLDLGGNETYTAGDLSQGANLGAKPKTAGAGFPDGNVAPGSPSEPGKGPSQDSLARRSVPGMLLDFGTGGTDRNAFWAGNHSQGFGRIFSDQSADSTDNAKSTYESIGILFSQSSHDLYDVWTRAKGVNSQGVAGQGGLGLLFDAAGNDRYNGTGLVSQGATVSQSYNAGGKAQPIPGAGVLVDAGGADTYRWFDALHPAGTIRSDRQGQLTITRSPVISNGNKIYDDLGVHLDTDTNGEPTVVLGSLLGNRDGIQVGTTETTLGQLLIDLPTAGLAIGDESANLYDNDYAFVVDLGGENVYNFSAAGFVPATLVRQSDPAGAGPLAEEDGFVNLFPVTFLFDAGNGTSQYNAPRGLSQGAGFFTVGVLVDAGGRDRFTAAPALGVSLQNDWGMPNEATDDTSFTIDGALIDPAWVAGRAHEVKLVEAIDERYDTTWKMRIANDNQKLYVGISGRTASLDGPNRTKDTLILDLNPRRHTENWDAARNNTGVDRVLVTFDATGRCSAADMYWNVTSYTWDPNVTLQRTPYLQQQIEVACTRDATGNFTVELAKPLREGFPYDSGDLNYAYDRDVGFVDSTQLGLRLEFFEAATTGRFLWPANAVAIDGESNYRKQKSLSDELAVWASTSLANRGERTPTPLNVRNASVTQGASIAGVGIVASLGTAGADETFVAGDHAQAYGIYGGLGMILDMGGSDRYEGTHFVQGVAETNGAGFLLENEGNDNYVTQGRSAGYVSSQGSAFALFLDISGQDEYTVPARAVTLGSGVATAPGEQSLQLSPTAAFIPPGNQRVWSQNAGLGVDYAILDPIRNQVTGLAENTVYGPTRTTLTITKYDELNAVCTTDAVPRPDGLDVLTGKVCLRALVDLTKGAAGTAESAAGIVVTGVESLDFLLNNRRVAGAYNVTGDGKFVSFEAVLDTRQLQDGVGKLRALATLRAEVAGRDAFLFYDNIGDGSSFNTATRGVYLNNPPIVGVQTGPAFVGIAGTAFSPNAPGDLANLTTNYTVSHDAAEDIYEVKEGWASPTPLRNQPCQTVANPLDRTVDNRLCNLVPLYIRKSSLTPNAPLSNTPSVRAQGSYDVETYNKVFFDTTSEAFRDNVTLEAIGGLHLSIPGRQAILPNEYSTTVRVRVGFSNGTTGPFLVDQTWNITQNPTPSEVLGALAGPYEAVRIVAQNATQAVSNVTSGDNALRTVLDLIFGAPPAKGPTGADPECRPGSINAACMILNGDIGYAGVRPCYRDNQWSFYKTNPILWQTLHQQGICYTHSVRNESYGVADLVGPIVSGGLGETPTEGAVDEVGNALETTPATQEGWTQFHLDIDTSALPKEWVTDGGRTVTLPRGAFFMLEVSTSTPGVGAVNEARDAVNGVYAPLVEEIVTQLDATLPPRGTGIDKFPTNLVRDQFGVIQSSPRDVVQRNFNQISQIVPYAIHKVDGGAPEDQPRLTLKMPAKPSTSTTLDVLDPLSEQVVATLLQRDLVGDILGTATRGNETVIDGFVRYRNSSYDDGNPRDNITRYTEYQHRFQGESLDDGLYLLRINSTDKSEFSTEATALFLLDKTPPASSVQVQGLSAANAGPQQYAGSAKVVGNVIPIEWNVAELGSGVRKVRVWAVPGEDNLTYEKWQEGYLGEFPESVRTTTRQVVSGTLVYHFITVAEDRVGNVEGVGSLPDREQAFAQALGAKVNASLWTRVTIDTNTPEVFVPDFERPVLGEGARALSFQGSKVQFIRAGADVRFQLCARDTDNNGLAGVSVSFVKATADDDAITRTYAAQRVGSCPLQGAEGLALYEYAGWGKVNVDKKLFPDGVWTAIFEAVDNAGNKEELTLATLILDSEAPRVNVRDPEYPAGQSAIRPPGLLTVRISAQDNWTVDEKGVSIQAGILNKSAAAHGGWLNATLERGVYVASFLVDQVPINDGLVQVPVRVADTAGNVRFGTLYVAIDDKTFTIDPASVRVTDVTHNSLVVRWNTTEPTSSQVKYDTKPGLPALKTPFNGTLVKEHAVKVEGLSPLTRYHLRALSSTAGGFLNETDVLEATTASALYLKPLRPAAGQAVSGNVEVVFEGGLRDSTGFVTYTLEAQSGADQPFQFVTTLTEQGERHALRFNSSRYLDGPGYSLRLTAEAGRDVTTATFGPFMSDNTPPKITVHAPILATNDTTPTLEADVKDNLAGFGATPVTLLIDGEPVLGNVKVDRVSDGLRVSHDVPSALATGHHAFELRVVDAAGNVAVETWKVAIDGEAPVVTVNPTAFSPGTEAARLGGTVILNLTIRDASGVSQVTADTSGIASAETLRLTRLVGTDFFTGTFLVTSSAADATLRVPITAIDLAGNARALGVDIRVDNTAPSVVGIKLGEAGFTGINLSVDGASEPVLLSGTASAPNSPPVTAATTTLAADAKLAFAGLLPSRSYAYTVQAIDRAGNAVEKSGSFQTRVDDEAPGAALKLSVLDLLNGTLRLSWEPADDNVAVAFYRVYRSDDGTRFSPVAEVKEPTYDDRDLPLEKFYSYQVVAVDYGGNEGPAQEKLRAAATAVPSLSAGLAAPTVGSTSTVFRYTVTYVSPGGVAPKHVRLLLDGVPQDMVAEEGGSVKTGITYVYETRLAPHKRESPHTYSFEASDGRYAVRFPADGSSLRGPLVSGDALAEAEASGFASFAQKVPVGGVAGTAGALLVAVLVVALVVRKKKEGSK